MALAQLKGLELTRHPDSPPRAQQQTASSPCAEPLYGARPTSLESTRYLTNTWT